MNLGRVDYGNMCDQQKMEKLVEGVEEVSFFMHDVDEGEFKEIANWPGVTSEENGDIVLEIDWRFKFLRGTMDLSWMPSMVTYFDISANFISGTLNAAALPRTLKHINIGSNKFSGTVDWELIPSNVEYVRLSLNQFKGSVDLNVLPSTLKTLNVNRNTFTSVSGSKRDSLNVTGIDSLDKIYINC